MFGVLRGIFGSIYIGIVVNNTIRYSLLYICHEICSRPHKVYILYSAWWAE